MDLVAEMLLCRLRDRFASMVEVVQVRPRFVRRFSAAGGPIMRRTAFNADRVLNRFIDYPRHLRSIAARFDLFHIVDHSYSHLAHYLPSGRVVITCHDLDIFRSLLQPESEPRSRAFRTMARRVADGFQLAVAVTCDSVATRDGIVSSGLAPASKLHIIPNGVDSIFSAEPCASSDARAQELLGPVRADAIDVLHVGSTAPRKRIDVLLGVFARISKRYPGARLLQVGGAPTDEQLRLASALGIDRRTIVVVPFVDRGIVAAVYRRAALALLPSEREGFGLPLIEALRCGTPVIASDIPVLRETGGRVATYCPVGDIGNWADRAINLLTERAYAPAKWAARRAGGCDHASAFSWDDYARKTAALYCEVIGE